MFKKFINKYKEEKQQKELLLARKDALLKEIAELEKERDRVKAHHELGNELQKLEDEREYLKLFYGNRYGSYGIWEDIPGHERWDGTFFQTHPVEITKTGVQDLSEKSLQWMRSSFAFSMGNPPPKYVYTNYTLWIEAIIPSTEGPILKLTDPFNSIFANPLKNISPDEANQWAGRMAVISLGLSNTDLNDYNIQSITLLPYTLTEKIKNTDEKNVYTAG